MKREPVIVSAVVGLVTAVLALLVAFNVPLTQTQQGAILGVVSAVLVVAGIIVRRFVTPVKPGHDGDDTDTDRI